MKNLKKKEVQKSISFLKKKLTLSTCTEALEIRNLEKDDLHLQLQIVGNASISIPEDCQKISIPPSGIRRIPVEIRKPDSKKGWPIARMAKKCSLIQVWKRGKGSKVLLDTIPVVTYSPVFVNDLKCFYQIEDYVPMPLRGNSPPEITMTAFEPGTMITKNTGTVEISWNITGADEITDIWTHVGLEVLEPGTFTDAGGDTSSDYITPATESFVYTPGASLNIALFAENDDGAVQDHEMIYHTINVGYHHAKCPAGASIYRDEVAVVREMLDTIDTYLRANRLADLPDFIDRWNAVAPASAIVGAWSDMAYLSGVVGSGNLADDMLAAMQDVLIYIKPQTLPRGYRPGTVPPDSGRHVLCEDEVWGLATNNWVSVCGADPLNDLTLAHELFHYASASHNEDELRATVISWAIFDLIPF